MSATRLLASVTLGILRLIVPIVIIAASVFGAKVLLADRATPERAPDRTPQATAVETMTATLETRRSVVTAYGTVQPRRRISIRPEVGGRVVFIHPDLIAGGRVSEGDTLLRIDPREYEYRVTEQKAALVRAEFDLTVERGRGTVARREWELLAETVERSELGARLARREPHLEEKLAAVEAADSRLAMARLNLERTEVSVPFNAVVLDETVETGQLINAQTPVTTLIGTDVFHVRVSIPVDRLSLITLPAADGNGGSRVSVLHDSAAGTPVPLVGRVVRLLGDVDPNGRMARILVAVDDPLRLATTPDGADASPLLVGEFVRVEIEGPARDRVVAIPRRALREDQRVWVMADDGRLEIREVTIAWGTETDVIVASGIGDGERVVTTPLAAPVPGMPLTDVADAAESDDDERAASGDDSSDAERS